MRIGRVALAAVITLFGLGCTKSEERARLSDGVPIAAIYRCKKVGPTETDCHLEIKTQPALDLPVPSCEHAELSEDASGKAIGYRCVDLHADEPWSVVRLRGARHLDDCNSAVGTGPKPDWSKLGAIEPRAMQLLDCAKGSAAAWSEIAQAILADSGPDLAAKFVVATTLRPPADMNDDGWARALKDLPPPAQELVKKETCPALQNGAAPPLLYARAATQCSFDGAAAGEVALKAFKNHLAASRQDFGGTIERTGALVSPTNLTAVEVAFAMEGLIAMKRLPQEAAEAACERLEGYSRNYDPVRVSVAASVLALTKTRCAHLERKSDLWPCDLGTPSKSKVADHVAAFATPPPGAAPILASPSEAVFEAISIDGRYPPDWKCP